MLWRNSGKVIKMRLDFDTVSQFKMETGGNGQMDMLTISEVSKQNQISTRMLRYYEKAGLIKSARVPGYSYRVYDEAAVRRLRQIMVLRKLRIPVKQIAVILQDETQRRTLDILQENLAQLEEEILAMATLRSVLKALVSRLENNIRERVNLEILEDGELMEMIHMLKPPKTTLKEEHSMSELMKAGEVLEAKMDIRIVYLPPATVASYCCVRENPEDEAGAQIYAFIRENNLPVQKPDFRLYGFNNPSPGPGQTVYGYEFWATIPEDMEVKAPFVKRRFAGGLYAAHCIKMGDFHEWATFTEAMMKAEEYEPDWREPEGMGGCLEEELNIYNNIQDPVHQGADQLDLLIPIRKRSDG